MNEDKFDYLRLLSPENAFNDREFKEVGFAIIYHKDFNHGTSGHLSYGIIAKLWNIIDLQHRTIKELKTRSEPKCVDT